MQKFIQKIKTVWPNLVYLKYRKSVRPLYRLLRPFYIVRSLRPIWFNITNRYPKESELVKVSGVASKYALQPWYDVEKFVRADDSGTAM